MTAALEQKLEWASQKVPPNPRTFEAQKSPCQKG